MIEIDVSDAERMARRMIDEAKFMEDRVDKALEESTVFLYNAARSSAREIRDTGELEESIRMDRNSGDRLKSLARRVYSTAAHGLFQEIGTSRFPPQPWLYPHLPTARSILNGKIIAATEKILADR